MRNPRASPAKFDEAHALAAKSSQADAESSVDASYCTPAYVEIQRATCWIDLGDPTRAVRLFEAELATLPREYRNDRGVYLARLARAYAGADEPEQSAGAATKALAIINQTGSGRTLAELTSVAHTVEPRQDVTAVATFLERFQVTRDRFAA